MFLLHLLPETRFSSIEINKAHNLSVFIEHETLSIAGDNFVSGITIKNVKNDEVKEIEVKGVFVEIGLIPNSDLAKGIVPFNKLGEIEVSCNGETDVPGLFAAGDVTSTPEKQIIIAAGEGAKAALQAYHYLQRLG